MTIARAIARIDAILTRADAEFREEDHPRAEDGKFGNKSGGKKAAKPVSALSKKINDITFSQRAGGIDHNQAKKIIGIDAVDMAKAMMAGLPDEEDASLLVLKLEGDRKGGCLVKAQTDDFVCEREFFIENGQKVVEHKLFTIADTRQGNGIAAKCLMESMKAYKKAKIDRVSLFAGMTVGAYAWAKYGFCPDKISWIGIKRHIRSTLKYYKIEDEMIDKWINDDDPKTIWKIADHPLGKKLLLESSWGGGMDLNDTHAYARCMAYCESRIKD